MHCVTQYIKPCDQNCYQDIKHCHTLESSLVLWAQSILPLLVSYFSGSGTVLISPAWQLGLFWSSRLTESHSGIQHATLCPKLLSVRLCLKFVLLITWSWVCVGLGFFCFFFLFCCITGLYSILYIHGVISRDSRKRADWLLFLRFLTFQTKILYICVAFSQEICSYVLQNHER